MTSLFQDTKVSTISATLEERGSSLEVDKVTFVNDTSRSPRAQVRPIAIERVELAGFVRRYQDLMKSTSLALQYDYLESSGRIDNFRKAIGSMEGDFTGWFFNDSDIYKWIEAASYSLSYDEDSEIQTRIESLITLIESVQKKSEVGYVNTYFTGERASEKWKDLKSMHELYCAGHLIQAGIAYKRVTGNESLFNVCVKVADNILKTFPDDYCEVTTGHPELEMAMIELHRETGNRNYLEFVQRLIDNRGKGYAGGDEYHIDHASFRDLKELAGHAVRMLYLLTGAADVFLETGDETLLAVLERLWIDLTSRKMYITGGAGSRYEGEAFGEAYELPSGRAYSETCAAIGNVFWNWRMYMLAGDAKYLDVLEKSFYNSVLSGISLDGRRYFYVNPLEDVGNHNRKEWFECACCPPNIARLLTSFSGYLYGTTLDEIRVNFYEASRASIPFRDGEVSIVQKTAFPHSEEVNLVISTDLDTSLSILLRIPEWTEGNFDLQIDGVKQKIRPEKGFVRLEGNWKGKTEVSLTLPMRIRMMTANPLLRENTDKVAIQRGPLIYCAEGIDNPTFDVRTLSVPSKRNFEQSESDALDGNPVVISGKGIAYDLDDWDKKLYDSLGSVKSKGKNVRFSLIPYYAWNNRGNSPMCVWLHVH